MKYQIYLNKQTSDYVNLIAKHENKRPNTMIKLLFESMIRMAIQASENAQTELERYGNGKRKE